MLTNIAIFVIGTAIAYLASYRLLKKRNFGGGAWEVVAIICFVSIVLAFFIFTYRVPELPLFRDPVTMKFGRF